MPRIEHVPLTNAAGGAAGDALARDGCVVITGCADEAARAALTAQLAPFEESAQPAEEQGADVFYPGNTKRTTGLVAKCPAASDLITHPAVLALADRFLLPSCKAYTLSVCSSLNIGPGARGQVLHREDGPYPVEVKGVLEGSEVVMWSMCACPCLPHPPPPSPLMHRNSLAQGPSRSSQKTTARPSLPQARTAGSRGARRRSTR